MGNSGNNGHSWKPNAQQQIFILAYAGNATAAAKEAGYANPGMAGHRMLKHDEIRKRIGSRGEGDNEKAIAGRQELQKFWTAKMEKADKDSDCLKASELLARSQGLFLDRTILSGDVEQRHRIDLSKLPTETIDALVKAADGNGDSS